MTTLKAFALGSVTVALLPITLPILGFVAFSVMVVALLFTEWLYAIAISIALYHLIRWFFRELKRRDERRLRLKTESVSAAIAEERTGRKLFTDGEQLPSGWSLQYSTRDPYYRVLDPDKQVRFSTNFRDVALQWVMDNVRAE